MQVDTPQSQRRDVFDVINEERVNTVQALRTRFDQSQASPVKDNWSTPSQGRKPVQVES